MDQCSIVADGEVGMSLNRQRANFNSSFLSLDGCDNMLLHIAAIQDVAAAQILSGNPAAIETLETVYLIADGLAFDGPLRFEIFNDLTAAMRLGKLKCGEGVVGVAVDVVDAVDVGPTLFNE